MVKGAVVESRGQGLASMKKVPGFPQPDAPGEMSGLTSKNIPWRPGP